MPMNLVLIGYRATGKSETARLLAQRLGWEWVDADAEIEARAGKTIAKIFADDGEQAFRDAESRVVAELAVRDRTVLALGGGAVLREENRRALWIAVRWSGSPHRPRPSGGASRATPRPVRGGPT